VERRNRTKDLAAVVLGLDPRERGFQRRADGADVGDSGELGLGSSGGVGFAPASSVGIGAGPLQRISVSGSAGVDVDSVAGSSSSAMTTSGSETGAAIWTSICAAQSSSRLVYSWIAAQIAGESGVRV
jgi:hypothetical protein